MNFDIASDSLRLLESTFTRNGHTFEKVEEGPSFFIYKVQREDAPRCWFEVFQRRVYPERTIAGKLIPASQAYPSDASFGVWAWTYPHIETARWRAGQIKPHRSTIQDSAP